MGTNREGIAAIIFAASALAIFVSLYYMQQLSVSIGVGSGAMYIVETTHNVTVPASLQGIVNGLSTFRIAIYITYMMFVLALISFLMATLQLFGNAHSRLAVYSVAVSAVLFIALLSILNMSFDLSQPLALYVLSYVSGAAMLAAAAYYILRPGHRMTKAAHRQISLNPSTPYTNLLLLSKNLFSTLEGDVKIVDMHFDSAGMENLALLIEGVSPKCSNIHVLANGERIGDTFRKRYTNLVTELANRSIGFEVRIMNSEDAAEQHERFIVDSAHAYKIPPLNIINKKSEHIVSIRHGEALRRFDYMWGRGRKI